MRKVVPQGNKKDFIFDSVRTRALVVHFVSEPAVGGGRRFAWARLG